MRRVVGCAGSEQAWLAEGLSGPAAPRLLSGTIHWSCVQWKSVLGRVVPSPGRWSLPHAGGPLGHRPVALTEGRTLPETPRPVWEGGTGPAETRLPALVASVPKSWFPPPRPAHPGLEQSLLAWPPLQAWWAGLPWPVSGGCSPGPLVGAEQRGEGAVAYSLSPVPSGRGSSPRPRAPLSPTQGMVLAGDDSCKADSALPPLHEERPPQSHPAVVPLPSRAGPHLLVGTGEDIQVHAGCVSCVWNGAVTPYQVFWGQTPSLWVPK